MSTPNTVDGLLKWWNTRFGIVAGRRNANLYVLAAAFNNYGIPQAEAIEVCLRYVDHTGPDPLTAREITATVSSAYRRTEHGVRQWTQGHRPTAPAPPRRTLSDAQARAVEDRLVEVLRRQWRTVPAPPPPPIADPITTPTPSPPRHDAEVLVRRMADRNPAINPLVDMLALDLSTAKITKLNTSRP